MIGLKSMKLALVGMAAAGALMGGLLLAGQVWAVAGTLGVSSVDLAPGAQGMVTLSANVGSPGLGAWSVDVTVANPNQVSIVSCSAPTGSVCNQHYGSGPATVRFAGASASGLMGAQNLGTVTVKCANSAGSSALTVSTADFADATVGSPQPITVTTSPGKVGCAPVLVVSGSGGSTSSGALVDWIAALAACGLLGVAGYGALQLRARRS